MKTFEGEGKVILVKNENGNRPVSAVYIVTEDATSLTVTGDGVELKGINMNTMTVDDFVDGDTIMFITEPYASLEVEAEGEGAKITVKGVY